MLQGEHFFKGKQLSTVYGIKKVIKSFPTYGSDQTKK